MVVAELINRNPNRLKVWTYEEEDAVMAYDRERLSTKEIVAKFNFKFTYSQINNKLYKLRGKKYKESFKKGWTQKEEEYLTDAFPRLQIETVCRKLRRTKSSVLTKAYVMGLNKSDRVEWLTASELGVAIGKQSHYVLRRIKSGEIKASREGAFWYISYSAAKEFIVTHANELSTGRFIDWPLILDILGVHIPNKQV